MSLPRALAGATVATLVGASVLAGAQRFGGRRPFQMLQNTPYDGRFTFVRVNYTSTPDGYWYGGIPAWAHGYPLAERNLMKILNEITFVRPHVEEINSLRLDDPELLKYPVAYIIEVDWWDMTDREAVALREYIEKGGFVIVDDFKVRGFGARFSEGYGGGGWDKFVEQMKRVVPEGRFYDLDISHPIFHCFFEIQSLDIPQAYIPGKPIFRGLYEDNDPAKRLQMIVNYNTDVSQYWEWSGRGFRPIEDTNEAYKLGVNYIVYGLTH